jgi:membrane protein implicated in regulation of membrane protease activity
MNCPNCGQPLEIGAAFCGNCGQPIAQLPPPDPAVLASVVPSAAPVAPTVQLQPIALPQPGAPLAQALSPIAQVYANQAGGPPPVSPFRGGLGNPMAALGGLAAGGIPAYAVPVSGQSASELKATLSLIFGIAGIGGAAFIPLVGLALGIAGIVLGTLSRHAPKRALSTTGLIFSILAILAGLASWTYVISHDNTLSHKAESSNADPAINGTQTTVSSVATPCYTVKFGDTLHVNNTSGSCDMSIYDGTTIDKSNDAYKIYGTEVATINASNFSADAKKAIDQDIQNTLPTFNITNEANGTFAGSPAFFATANNGAGVSIMEAAVLHYTTNGDNFFVFVHAITGKTVDLSALESTWAWQ